MTNRETNSNEDLLRRALDQAPQPIAIVDGHVESREKLAELLSRANTLPDCSDCKGVVVYYRTIEHLFPSSHLSDREFHLTIPEYSELTKWAGLLGWEVDYLDGTEKMTLRPFHFTPKAK